MTPDRGQRTNEDLLDRINKTLEILQRRDAQLDVALRPYSSGGRGQFEADFGSNDADQRNRAELVHTGFERHHQLIRDLLNNAGKLAARTGVIADRTKGTWHAHLNTAGLLSKPDYDLIEDHKDLRDEGQHAYTQADPGTIYDAADRQLKDGRKLIAHLANWVDNDLRPRV